VAYFGSKGDSKIDWRQSGLEKPGKAILECRGKDNKHLLMAG
jgi:hypothetical protein